MPDVAQSFNLRSLTAAVTAAAESTAGLLVALGRLISSMESTVSRQMGHLDVCFRSSVAQSPHMHICLPAHATTATRCATQHTLQHASAQQHVMRAHWLQNAWAHPAASQCKQNSLKAEDSAVLGSHIDSFYISCYFLNIRGGGQACMAELWCCAR